MIQLIEKQKTSKSLFGNKINLIKNPFSSEILTNVNSSNNLSKIYLKGGEGLMAEMIYLKIARVMIYYRILNLSHG